MNIGSLIRGLLGEQRAGESKTLDMKPGQVVRGVVMNVSEDGQEAVVQIQGVQVKAKLETPLRAGETALLQVQPPGEEGAVVLKPLGQSPNQTLTPSSMIEVLEFANLPDTKENREMIRGMQTVGIPLTKENIAQFKEMLAVKPPQVPLTEWIESSAIAFHRGLPITAESVKGLYQAVFGPQLHELLQSLENQLGEALQGRQSNKGQLGPTAGNNPVAGMINGKNEGMANMPAVNPDRAGEPALQTGAGDRPPLVADSARSGQQALLTKLQSLLSQLRGELAQQAPWAGAAAPQPAQGTAGTAMPPAVGQAAVAPGPAAESAPPPLAQAAQPGEGAAGPSPKPPTHGAEPWVGRLLKLLGAEHEQQVLRGGAQPPAQGAAASTAAAGQSGSPNPLGGGSGTGPNIAAEAPRDSSAAPAAQGASATAQDKAGAVPNAQTAQRSAQETGISQTATSTHTATQTGQSAQTASAGLSSQVQTANGTQGSATNLVATANTVDQTDLGTQPSNNAGVLSGNSSTDVKETLKGLLLQLAASNDIPPALKEAVGQLIQHMTGQQLLLNTDRTAPFAQVTMFIPLHGSDGEQTASVHIQSRRGRKGELDATNCRLWFDLDMKHLGPTVIDVHVVDRIVSLNMRNDQPWVSELFESRRSDLVAGVESIGYQLLSMKTSPFPEVSESDMDHTTGNTASEYTPQTYKGVDYRI